MKYLVEVVETLSRHVIVDAENLVQAEEKVRQAYIDGQIVLDYDDFEESCIEAKRIVTDDEASYYETLEVEE